MSPTFDPEILARIRNDVGVKILNKNGCKFEFWKDLGCEKELQIINMVETIKELKKEGWEIVRCK